MITIILKIEETPDGNIQVSDSAPVSVATAREVEMAEYFKNTLPDWISRMPKVQQVGQSQIAPTRISVMGNG